MESWIWAIVGVVPVVAVGAAYALGAFSTNIPSINQQIAKTQEVNTAFTGDNEENHLGGKRKKTKKSVMKHKHKKTNRRK
jgi:hypothetical protein